jgi:hypothetical protein
MRIADSVPAKKGSTPRSTEKESPAKGGAASPGKKWSDMTPEERFRTLNLTKVSVRDADSPSPRPRPPCPPLLLYTSVSSSASQSLCAHPSACLPRCVRATPEPSEQPVDGGDDEACHRASRHRCRRHALVRAVASGRAITVRVAWCPRAVSVRVVDASLCCIVLCCVVLCCAVLCCVVLCCVVLCRVAAPGR